MSWWDENHKQCPKRRSNGECREDSIICYPTHCHFQFYHDSVHSPEIKCVDCGTTTCVCCGKGTVCLACSNWTPRPKKVKARQWIYLDKDLAHHWLTSGKYSTKGEAERDYCGDYCAAIIEPYIPPEER